MAAKGRCQPRTRNQHPLLPLPLPTTWTCMSIGFSSLCIAWDCGALAETERKYFAGLVPLPGHERVPTKGHPFEMRPESGGFETNLPIIIGKGFERNRAESLVRDIQSAAGGSFGSLLNFQLQPQGHGFILDRAIPGSVQSLSGNLIRGQVGGGKGLWWIHHGIGPGSFQGERIRLAGLLPLAADFRSFPV